METRSTLKKSKETKKAEEFLEYLKFRAVEIDGSHVLPSVCTINLHQNSSSIILEKLMKEGRIVSLGRRVEVDPNLIKKIEEALDKEPEKKGMWFWRQFFINPARSKEGVGAKYFRNTSILYRIK